MIDLKKLKAICELDKYEYYQPDTVLTLIHALETCMEALEFYADETHWYEEEVYGDKSILAAKHGPERARTSLAEVEKILVKE